MEDFSPHQLDPVHERDLKLYHVYDALSQTPYERGYGIEAGDKNTYYMRYCCRINLRLIEKHLDWNQEEPTSFISLFDTPESALKEARRRMSHRTVRRKGKWCRRGPVFVAVISPHSMAEEGVFFFSARDLTSDRMLDGCGGQLAGKLGSREWFAMDYIPDSAVELVVGEDSLRNTGCEGDWN